MAVDFHMAIVKAFHAQKNKIRPGMAKTGLSCGQPKVLRHLSKHNNCMQKDIASAFDIEPATVSQILNNMAEKGLIKRSAPLERKRAECISITEKGMESYKKWQKICDEVVEISLKGFTQKEREQFIDYLSRMYENLTGKTID